NRYTVSRTPPIRPIQFSALKALDPLDEQPQHRKGDNGQADIEKVLHGSLLGLPDPGRCALDSGVTMQSYLGGIPVSSGPCGTHAGGRETLTEPMRPDVPARVTPGRGRRRPGHQPPNNPGLAGQPRRRPTSWARASRSAGSA